MSPLWREASARELEVRLSERLAPLGGAPERPSVARHSDWDLNPDAPRASKPPTLAAVLVALVERASGLQLILTRRAEGLSRHPGQIAFAGGRVERGETVTQAALREAQEEIGLEPRWVRPIGLADAYLTVTHFHVTPVVAFVDARASLRPHEAEVAEVFEAPFAWAMDPANLVRGEHEVDGLLRRYEVLQYGDRRIWGATAGIIRGLRERLFAD